MKRLLTKLQYREILALVKAKWDEHIVGLDVHFERTIIKWNRISMQVINARHSNQFKNRVACKDKWGSYVRDFKKIYDYIIGTKNNQDYRSMTNTEKSTTKLPQKFWWGLYDIHDGKILRHETHFQSPPHLQNNIDETDHIYWPFGIKANDAIKSLKIQWVQLKEKSIRHMCILVM